MFFEVIRKICKFSKNTNFQVLGDFFLMKTLQSAMRSAYLSNAMCKFSKITKSAISLDPSVQ